MGRLNYRLGMFEERIGELEDKLGKYLDYNRGRGGK